MAKGIEVRTRRERDGVWRVLKNRRPTRYFIREVEGVFHVECTDDMHHKTQVELFPLTFPHQQACVMHVWNTYISKGY